MTEVTMTALPGHVTEEPGYGFTGTVIEYLGETYGRRKAEAADAASMARAIKAFGDEVAASRPDASFYVSVSPSRGSRKFRGYDAARKSGAFGEEAWMKVVGKPNYAKAGLEA